MTERSGAALSGIIDSATKAFPTPPVVHFFRTRRRRYVYDAYTGEIATSDPLSDDILSRLGNEDCTDFFWSKAAEVGEGPVIAAAQKIIDIAKGRNPRMLLGSGPTDIAFYLTLEEYTKAVEQYLEQMILVPTYNCNLGCYYCTYSGKYAGRPKHAPTAMTEETLEAALKYFVTHSEGNTKTVHLGFYGGEPTLCFGYVEYAIGYLKKALTHRTWTIGLSTNFVNVTPEMMRTLIKNNVKLYISLDGPAHVHDRYRVRSQGGGSFKDIMNNLRVLREMDPEYYTRSIMFNVTAVPPYRLSEIREFFENEDLLRRAGLLISPVGEPRSIFPDCTQDFLVNDEAKTFLTEYKMQAIRGAWANGGKPQFLAALFDRQFLSIYRRLMPKQPGWGRWLPGGMCIMGQRKLLVNPDGTFLPCEKVPDYDWLRMGNVHDGFDAKKAYSLYEDYASLGPEECRKCWAILICSHVCVKDAGTSLGLSREKRAQLCAAVRNENSRMLSVMCEVLEENPRALDFLNGYSTS